MAQYSDSLNILPMFLLSCCAAASAPSRQESQELKRAINCILDHDVAAGGLTWTLRASTELNLLDVCAGASAQRALVSRVL